MSEPQPGSFHPSLEALITWMEVQKHPTEDQLRRVREYIAEDKSVSRKEAEDLFHLKNKFPELHDVDGFKDLFVEAITSHVLYTGETAGALGRIEEMWLSDNIARDFAFDDLEEALLMNIALEAVKLPPNFHDMIRRFEQMPEESPIKKKKPFFDKLKGLVIGK